MGVILVAYDGSESAKRALDYAAKLANGDRVTVVSVAEELPQFGRAPAMVVPEEHEERLRELSEAVAALQAKGIALHAVERHGDPAALIVDEAEKEHAELIVIGTRGLSAAKRWLLGSVSTKVLHHAPCDVLVVR
jgi:nucleotide-binding universal stress UspA family protein